MKKKTHKTCMGSNHALMKRRQFDVCIIDEAGQLTQPGVLPPLLKAKRFVLVGDHFQVSCSHENSWLDEVHLNE